MKSSYKRLGDYIHEVNIRNKELHEIPLLGVSITKKFIPSIANIVGTNMATYKLIEKNQFAYGPVTSRNGDKISIALSDEHDKAMVSQAYTVFDVNDANEVLPEYLMMWFRRTEFDRYARFMSHGSAREIFSWAELCDTLIPIPSPEKQREIVKEYKVIQNRIALNNQLIAKLEETAQTIYKQWFVDFEFPDENGKPYKSNGGVMKWCEELEKDVPLGWEVENFENIIEITSGKTQKNKSDLKDFVFIYPLYGAGGIMGFTSEYLFNEKILSIGRVGTHGVIQRINFPCWPSDNTLVFKSDYYEFTFQILQNINYDELNRGGVQGLITQTDIKNLRMLIPLNNILKSFEDISSKVMTKVDNIKLFNDKLSELNELLLARMTKVESEIETVEN